MNYNIAVVKGDGIGPEVIAEGVKVLDEVARLDGGFKFEFELRFVVRFERLAKTVRRAQSAKGEKEPDEWAFAQNACPFSARKSILTRLKPCGGGPFPMPNQ